MPQLYNDAVITAAGAALLDKIQAGLATIQFTRLATGDGTYTVEEKEPSVLRGCTGLKAQRNSYPLSSVGTVPGGGMRLTALITNQDPVTGQALVSEGYSITEIGLFAREKDGADDAEVLYSITVATYDIGDYMPPYTDGAPAQIVQEYRARVSDAASVSINSAGAVMLAEDAERRFSAIEEAIEGAGGGLIEDETPTFEQAEERENIASGESMGTILGKIKKFFADLKKVAFTGSYNDLSDTPSLFSGKYGDLSGKPDLFSGDYNDLANKPDIPEIPAGIRSGYVRAGQKGGTDVGENATAEGYNTTASGNSSHAEGYFTVTGQFTAHAEGRETTANAESAHAEGCATKASGHTAHAEGNGTTASGDRTHAEGSGTTASGYASHTQNCSTIASSWAQTAMGYCNVPYDAGTYGITSYLIIGNGTEEARSNAFRVHNDGSVFGKASYQTSGADYAEYFEMLGGDPGDEDMRGYFVTLSGDRIRKADPGDGYILGIISANPVVLGNSDPDNWHRRFLKDEFGCYIKRPVTERICTGMDEAGDEVYEEVTHMSYVLDPEFDETKDPEYMPRADRPEWQPVGMLGQLIVRDDGTCGVDGYCKVAEGGIATRADGPGWRVIKRVNDHLVKVIFR